MSRADAAKAKSHRFGETLGRPTDLIDMPRYFFDTTNGETAYVDTDGMELVDDEDARKHALEALPDMASDDHARWRRSAAGGESPRGGRAGGLHCEPDAQRPVARRSQPLTPPRPVKPLKLASAPGGQSRDIAKPVAAIIRQTPLRDPGAVAIRFDRDDLDGMAAGELPKQFGRGRLPPVLVGRSVARSGPARLELQEVALMVPGQHDHASGGDMTCHAAVPSPGRDALPKTDPSLFSQRPH